VVCEVSTIVVVVGIRDVSVTVEVSVIVEVTVVGIVV
jgi:hypothetical protein